MTPEARKRQQRAERQRRYRLRQRLCRLVVSIEIDHNFVSRLINGGHLDIAESEDLAAISRAATERLSNP